MGLTVKSKVDTQVLDLELAPSGAQQIRGGTLLSELKQITAKTGSVIFREKDVADYLLIVLRGEIELLSGDGALCIARHTQGDIFGNAEILTGTRRHCEARAVTDCCLVAIPSAQLEELMLRCPTFAIRLLRACALQLIDAREKALQLAADDVPTRTLKALKAMATPRIVNGIQILLLKKRPPFRKLEAIVGSKREVISRAIKLLANSGEIYVKGKQIVIKAS